MLILLKVLVEAVDTGVCVVYVSVCSSLHVLAEGVGFFFVVATVSICFVTLVSPSASNTDAAGIVDTTVVVAHVGPFCRLVGTLSVKYFQRQRGCGHPSN